MDTPSAPSVAPVAPAAPAKSTPANSATTAARNASTPAAKGAQSTTPNPSVTNSKHADATPAPVAGAEGTTAAEKRRFRMKVDGAEQDLELTDEEISIRLQKSTAAEKRMQEAAEIRKKDAAYRDALKKDPIAALKAEGIDIEALVEQRLIEDYKRNQLPEHEQRMLEQKKQAEQYKAELDGIKAEQQRVQQEQLETRVAQQTQEEFFAALEGSNLPKDRQTMRMMAEIALINLEHGIELTPAQMAAEVSDRLRGMNRNVVSTLKGEQLISYLGEDVVKEILRFKVEQSRAPRPFTPPAPVAAPVDDEPLKPTRSTDSLRAWRKFTRD